MEEVIEALQSLFIHPDRLLLSPHDIIGKSQFEVRAALLDKQHNVAVKLIPFSSLAGDQRMLLSLKKEVLAMKECESEFVVQLMGVCLWEREVGIVMERMADSLGAYAYGSKKLTLSYGQMVQAALKMAQGLERLHEKGFVHRDVKPENILVSADMLKVKWTDFGLASALLTSVVATKTNVGAGTPHFMSPEQTSPSGIMTRAADVWSFGCLLLCLLTGNTPWPAEWNTIQVAMAMLMEKRTPTVPDSLPTEMRTLLRQCLTWEAAERPTASQLVSTLHGILWEMLAVKAHVPPSTQQTAPAQLITVQQPPSSPAAVTLAPSSSDADIKSTPRFDLADKGETAYQVAQDYIYGRGGFMVDVRKGAELLKQAAEMGHPRAMFEWGMCLFKGLYFVKIDKKHGEALIVKAAEAGDQLAVACCYKEGWAPFEKDLKRHFELLQSLDVSDPWVMFGLGEAYYRGCGVDLDDNLATRWFDRAADSGLVLGYYWLGDCHFAGRGVSRDVMYGLNLYQAAADRGYAYALFTVGQYYDNSPRAVTKNVSKAIECYKLALAQGWDCARNLKRLGVSL